MKNVRYNVANKRGYLYYGLGACSIEGFEIIGLEIKYKGKVSTESTAGDGYILMNKNNTIIMFPIAQHDSLNSLFRYSGTLEIISATAIDKNFKQVLCTIIPQMDYSELLRTKAEDMTTNSENLKGQSYYKQKIQKKDEIIKNLYSDNEFYLSDGTAYNSGTFRSDPSWNNAELCSIGAEWDDTPSIGDFFKGSLSELFLYNIYLSQSQVKTLYNGREPYNHKEGIASANLVAWYRMGDGTLDRVELTGTENVVISDMAHPSTMGNNNLVSNGTFTTWDSPTAYGDDPGTWAIEHSDASSYLTDISPGIRFTWTDSEDLYITQSILTAGTTYKMEIQIDAISGTGAKIRTYEGYYNIGSFTTVGTHTAYWVATGTTFILAREGTAGSADIARVAVYAMTGYAGAGVNMSNVTAFSGDTP